MKRARSEAFVCANDHTAGNLMHALLALGYRIPDQVRRVPLSASKSFSHPIFLTSSLDI